MNQIFLNFDLEEFNLPLEFKEKISKKDQQEITLKGLENLLELNKANSELLNKSGSPPFNEKAIKSMVGCAKALSKESCYEID